MQKSTVFKKRLVSLFLVNFLFLALMIEYTPLTKANPDYQLLQNGYFDQGQGTVSASSSPWYFGLGTSYTTSIHTFDTSSWGGSWPSYIFGCELPTLDQEVSYIVLQNVPFINSSTITDFRCGLGTTSATDTNAGLKFYYFYSDNSQSSYTSGNWTIHNNAPNWLDINTNGITSNKVLTIIGLRTLSNTPNDNSLWIYNASLTGTQQSGTFTWFLVPAPMTITTYSFQSPYNVAYTFYGNFSTNVNGTFTATSNIGKTIGLVSLGKFNFTITPRIDPGYNDLETFVIVCTFGSQTFQLNVLGYWISAMINTQNPNAGIPAVALLIVPLLFLFLPALLLAGIAGTAGLIAGFCLGDMMLVVIGWFPAWTLFFIGLCIILLIFFGKSPHREE